MYGKLDQTIHFKNCKSYNLYLNLLGFSIIAILAFHIIQQPQDFWVQQPLLSSNMDSGQKSVIFLRDDMDTRRSLMVYRRLF